MSLSYKQSLTMNTHLITRSICKLNRTSHYSDLHYHNS